MYKMKCINLYFFMLKLFILIIINYMDEILLKKNENLENINKKLENIEKRIDILENKVDGEIINECKKMGSHIDFVETVYENVKHPLGYINNKIKSIIGNEDTTYSLTEK